MRKYIFYIFILIFFILSFFMIEKKQTQKVLEEENNEKKAVFLSYLELNKYIKNKDEKTSKNNIVNILDNMKDFKFNMLIVHVRPFSDAIYNSDIYPISETVKNNNKDPNYDVLDYIIQEAKKRNIEVHAWINPYRISNDTDITKINKDNPAYNLIDTDAVEIVEEKGIFYNPASEEVKNLIISGVKELVSNYEIDGIHLDDYFYPDADIDIDSYKTYIEQGGSLSLSDYRYNNILTLIKEVYSTIKEINNNVVFGISPEGNIENNYNKHYLDVKKILSEEGYIDYIMPQIYFGFLNEVKPFTKTVEEWNDMIKVDNIKIIPALAFYKVGEYDKYAKSGCNEWIENNDIIANQILESRELSNYYGFALFRYDYIFDEDKYNNTTLEEIENLKDVLNNN